jgi:hypothetical protein
LKQDYRLCRNYLKGIPGDNLNLILAAAAMNLNDELTSGAQMQLTVGYLFIK